MWSRDLLLYEVVQFWLHTLAVCCSQGALKWISLIPVMCFFLLKIGVHIKCRYARSDTILIRIHTTNAQSVLCFVYSVCLNVLFCIRRSFIQLFRTHFALNNFMRIQNLSIYVNMKEVDMLNKSCWIICFHNSLNSLRHFFWTGCLKCSAGSFLNAGSKPLVHWCFHILNQACYDHPPPPPSKSALLSLNLEAVLVAGLKWSHFCVPDGGVIWIVPSVWNLEGWYFLVFMKHFGSVMSMSLQKWTII